MKDEPRSPALTAEQRQALEARHTWARLVELRLNPVQGKFDAWHLKEINRRIFQDLPSLGFGEIRHADTRRAITLSLDQFGGNRNLPDLLHDAIQPKHPPA